MTDEATPKAEAAPIVPRKWARGRPRRATSPIARDPIREPMREPMREAPSARPKMRMAPNWEDMVDAPESQDRLHIPRDMVPEGMDLMWVTSSVYGRPEGQHRAQFEKRGWTPVYQEDFDGRFDGMFMQRGKDGEIEVEGVVLMARPMEISRKARERDRREAVNRVRLKEQQFTGGGMNATGAAHPSALNQNRISKTRELIEVPEE